VFDDSSSDSSSSCSSSYSCDSSDFYSSGSYYSDSDYSYSDDFFDYSPEVADPTAISEERTIEQMTLTQPLSLIDDSQQSLAPPSALPSVNEEDESQNVDQMAQQQYDKRLAGLLGLQPSELTLARKDVVTASDASAASMIQEEKVLDLSPAAAGVAGAAANGLRTVSLYGFRGAGDLSPEGLNTAEHPYLRTGHVGYSLNGGYDINGFGPDVPPDMSPSSTIESLKNGGSYAGKIDNDTKVFEMVAKEPEIARSGLPQEVIEQKIQVPRRTFEAIKSAQDRIGIDVATENARYSFPGKDGTFAEGTFNCATFPEELGIPVPESTGNMKSYMPALEQVGQPWKGSPPEPIQQQGGGALYAAGGAAAVSLISDGVRVMRGESVDATDVAEHAVENGAVGYVASQATERLAPMMGLAKASGAVAGVVEGGVSTYNNVEAYHQGEESAAQATANIAVDTGTAVVAGMAGMKVGAIVGSFIEPGGGTAVGAAVGFGVGVATYAAVKYAAKASGAMDAAKEGLATALKGAEKPLGRALDTASQGIETVKNAGRQALDSAKATMNQGVDSVKNAVSGWFSAAKVF